MRNRHARTDGDATPDGVRLGNNFLSLLPHYRYYDREKPIWIPAKDASSAIVSTEPADTPGLFQLLGMRVIII